MDVVKQVITIILLLVSVMLIVVVLMQKSKEGGLGSAFGGDNSTFSSKGQSATKEVKLRKLTVVFASIVGVLALVMIVL